MGYLIHFTPNRMASLYIAVEAHMKANVKKAKEKYGDAYKILKKKYKKCEKLKLQGRDKDIPEELQGFDMEVFKKVRKDIANMVTCPSGYEVIAMKYPVFILDLPNGEKRRVQATKENIKNIVNYDFETKVLHL